MIEGEGDVAADAGFFGVILSAAVVLQVAAEAVNDITLVALCEAKGLAMIPRRKKRLRFEGVSVTCLLDQSRARKSRLTQDIGRCVAEARKSAGRDAPAL